MQQAEDFRAECMALRNVLSNQSDDVFDRTTLFKNWTINDVIGHLHMFNVAARLTLEDGDKFDSFFEPVAAELTKGRSMLQAQYSWLGEFSGPELFEAWSNECEKTATAYASADPKARVKWAGPDMSARSSITARQMETWAHGQEIFDCLGLERIETDRIRNIAHLGVSTFGWTFINRKEAVPEPAPYLKLKAPSGEMWEWNAQQTNNLIEGDAVEFCQVVAQTRNVADTRLSTTGEVAKRWMSIAQCFAGPPEEPPAPGLRTKSLF